MAKAKSKTPMKSSMAKDKSKTPMKKPASTHLPGDIGRLKSRLSADIASHLQREKKKRATPTAPWKVRFRGWQDWTVLEPQTLQTLLTLSWKNGISVVKYTWPVKGRDQSKPVKVQFEVDLAKLEVRNTKTNSGYPLQCSGPL